MCTHIKTNLGRQVAAFLRYSKIYFMPLHLRLKSVCKAPDYTICTGLEGSKYHKYYSKTKDTASFCSTFIALTYFI